MKETIRQLYVKHKNNKNTHLKCSYTKQKLTTHTESKATPTVCTILLITDFTDNCGTNPFVKLKTEITM